MIHNYFYQIAIGLQSFDSLSDARKAQKRIIKSDLHTRLLFRDNKGYYILKKYLDGRKSKVIR